MTEESTALPETTPRDPAGAALDEAVTLAFRLLKGAMGVLFVLFLGSGFFTVQPHEVAFVERMGGLDTQPREAGAHWSWPALDRVVRVDARAERHVVDTFNLLGSGDPTAVLTREGGLDPANDGYLLSGDANVVHVTLAARVAARDPYRTLVCAEDPEALVRVLCERAAVRAAASRQVDALLGAGKTSYIAAVQRDLQDALDAPGVQAGLRVEKVKLERDLVPPPQVRDAFGDVSRATQQRDAVRSSAQSEAAQIRGAAVAAAARMGSRAESDAERLVAEAAADAAVFSALLDERRELPRALERRLLATRLGTIFAGVEEVFLLGEGETLRLRLERDPRDLVKRVERDARERIGVPTGGGE